MTDARGAAEALVRAYHAALLALLTDDVLTTSARAGSDRVHRARELLATDAGVARIANHYNFGDWMRQVGG